jgi:tRNA 2-thiouridine synthesizing protein A
MTMPDQADQTVDARGLTCPMPILKAKKALGGLTAGQTLEVLATDPAAPGDFVAFCSATGHDLIDNSAAGGTYRFLIRRGG